MSDDAVHLLELCRKLAALGDVGASDSPEAELLNEQAAELWCSINDDERMLIDAAWQEYIKNRRS
jgi:hypothetical protein